MDIKYGEHFGWSLWELEEEPDLDMDEVMACIEKAIYLTIGDPYHARPLKRSPLIGYRSRHFHSKLRPPERMQPDMRLIYRVTEDTLYLEVVGLRRQREKSQDIYTLFEDFFSDDTVRRKKQARQAILNRARRRRDR